jgi:hypothetical protein
MRARLFLAFLCLLLMALSRGDEVLFFGNSFTFGASVPGLSAHGGVPALVQAIARTKADSLLVKSLTSPGVDWSYHLAQPATAAALGSRVWTWVVLQDYSTRPTRMGNAAQFLADGLTFSKRIAEHSPHAGIVLYETWARPPGAFYKTSGGRQFSGPADMMDDLHQAYARLAAKLAALHPERPVRVAPVGRPSPAATPNFPASRWMPRTTIMRRRKATTWRRWSSLKRSTTRLPAMHRCGFLAE